MVRNVQRMPELSEKVSEWTPPNRRKKRTPKRTWEIDMNKTMNRRELNK